MLKKIFSKRTFIITGITYILVILVFLIGYFTYSGGGFFSFGPEFSGIALSLLATPFILGGSIIYIIVKKQNIIYVLIGYLILTVGIGSVSVGYVTERDRQREIHNRQQWQETTRQAIAFIENTIGEDVRRVYPDAEFYVQYMSGYGDDIRWDAFIRLGGFRFGNQPNFDEEISNWREITQSASFRDFPHRISVRYYFENAQHSFASILLSNFTLRYFTLGMSGDGFAYLTPILEDYLSNFHDDFSIWTDWRFRVTIHKELSREDELNEEEMWQNFVRLHNINTELVEIVVSYRLYDVFAERFYNVSQNRWFGSQ